jgi:hypothetical protein
VKKTLLKLFFSFAVFVAFLVLTEIVFALNQKYNWIEPQKASNLPNVSKMHFSPLSPALVAEIKNRLSHEDHVDEETFNLMMSQSGSNFRKLTPISVEKYIEKFAPETGAIKINDKSVNKLLNRVVFDVNYQMDSNGTRNVPGQILDVHKKNILLIGCSLTFGTGVNDNETTAYHLKQKMPNYNIYNLGLPGGGLSDILDDITKGNRLKFLSKKGGAVVYYFIYDHFERTFCSLDCYRKGHGWVIDKNEYEIDSKNQLVNRGPYRTSRSQAQFFLNNFLSQSEFLKFIGIDHPHIYTLEQQRKYARLLLAAKNYYAKYNLEFYVYARDIGGLEPEFFELLSENGIKFIYYDFFGLELKDFNDLTIAGDGHASNTGNYVNASLIAEVLKANGY